MNPITAQVADVLRTEADALVAAAARLRDADVVSAVELVAGCAGNVVLLGAGTSGLIARKLSATLTSTGTPSLYLHPTDALHGALGVVTSRDVVIAISNSGETDEVLAALPYLRRREVGLIAIVGSLTSTLARQADVALDAYAEREADPHNLAPTSSSTVALAIGDALAMAVMTQKGVTSDAFARNHPSGRLGRRLTLEVRDVMSPGPTPAVAPSAGWVDLVAAISRGGLGAAVVIEGGRLMGIVTDGDIRRRVGAGPPDALAQLVAADVMTTGPVTVPVDALAYDALRLMEERPSPISVLPVMDGVQCAGLVRLHDLVRAGL